MAYDEAVDERPPPAMPAARTVYEAAGVVRRYAGMARPAIAEVSFQVRAGEVFGVLGRNGAGKSTLVRLMVGLLAPDAGQVLLDGRKAGDPLRIATSVAYLPQHETALTDMTVQTAVETTARLRGLPRRQARARAGQVLAELGLEALAGTLTQRLSGGQRRLAAVATALVADRQILVLDEPTTGLDHHARRSVWAALDRRRTRLGTAVVLVTHDVLEAEKILDRVLVLHAGRVAGCDTPGRLKARFDGLARLELLWRAEPPAVPAGLGERAVVRGRRWSVRLPIEQAPDLLRDLLAGPARHALDDFTLAPPSLEDVLLAAESGEAR